MSIIRVKKAQRKPYVILDTTALNDARLSFRAKGLHTYLMAKPDDWQIFIQQLEHASAKDGRDAVRAALKELIDAGYLKRKRQQDSKTGKMAGWESTVYETPALAEEEAMGDGASQSVAESGFTDVGQTDVGSTDIGFADVGQTDVGSTEVGSANVGKSDTTKEGLNKRLTELKIEEPTPLPPEEEHAGNGPIVMSSPRTADPKPWIIVLIHLNTILGRQYRVDKHIKARLQTGYTVEDCLLVIDWLHIDRRAREPDWVEKYLDPTTPFREDNFDKYLQRAREWNAQGRRTPTPNGADHNLDAWVKAEEAKQHVPE
jgi:uncharacterized phage protein (TIGR02220 family)